MRDFKKGDKVRFGVDEYECPGWSPHSNLVGWRTGVVASVYGTQGTMLVLEYSGRNGFWTKWYCMQPSHPNMPKPLPKGYPEIIDETKELPQEEVSVRKCTCPWETVYHHGCKCGGV